MDVDALTIAYASEDAKQLANAENEIHNPYRSPISRLW